MQDVNELDRQKMIIRQNALNRAVDLLNSEQERANSEITIPLESIFELTRKLEDFIWSACTTKTDVGKEAPKVEPELRF